MGVYNEHVDNIKCGQHRVISSRYICWLTWSLQIEYLHALKKYEDDPRHVGVWCSLLAQLHLAKGPRRCWAHCLHQTVLLGSTPWVIVEVEDFAH